MFSIQRVLHGTTDISQTINDFRTGAYTFAYQAGQYLYLGSEKPFNNLYFEVGTANDQASVASVDIFWGVAWHAAVDVIDDTAAAGASLAESGRISWSTDIFKGWDLIDRPAQYSALGVTAEIYWMYWARLKWSADLNASTTLKYLGQKFSDDTALFSYYPDLKSSDVMTAYGAGAAKSDWNEQAYMAAEIIIRELMAKKIILARGQIFDWTRFLEPSCHKVAELVYRGLGSAFDARREAAAKDYKAAMNRDFFRVDVDQDGQLSPRDKAYSQTFMTR
jgi:hypothetical protein